jgi:hypothetical protein
MPEEEEFEDTSCLDGFVNSRHPDKLFPVFWSSKRPPSFVPVIPSACVVDALLALPEKDAPSFRICEKGVNFPRSLYRHATKYTPGAAKVDNTQRIESMSVLVIRFGMRCHPIVSGSLDASSPLSNREVFSLMILPLSFSAFSGSPSAFSLVSSREFLLDSVPTVDVRMFP